MTDWTIRQVTKYTKSTNTSAMIYYKNVSQYQVVLDTYTYIIRYFKTRRTGTFAGSAWPRPDWGKDIPSDVRQKVETILKIINTT